VSSERARRKTAHGPRWTALAFALLLPGCPLTDDYYMKHSARPPGSTDPLSTCGNAAREGTEECDGEDLAGARCDTRGFATGTLKCGATCLFDVSGCSMMPPPPGCGDRIADPGEQCDGTDFQGMTCEMLGAGSGRLACTAACQFDTSSCVPAPVCGDGKAEGGEACDGADLKQQTCSTKGFDAGTLSCSPSCELVTSACTSEAKAVCGDAQRGGDEDCDGTDLGGGSCPAKGFSGGVLACGEDCHFDTGGCTKGPSCDFDGGSRTGVILRADTSLQTSSVATWSCSAGGSGPDVSVTWTASVKGCYQVMVTSDEDLDTILGVFNDCDRGKALACDDNSGADQFSLLEFEAAAGSTYAVVVDSYFKTDTGPIQVRISPCAPPQWTCDPARFGRDDGCDCGCGALDPDCEGSSAASACAFCDAPGSCAAGLGCDAIHSDKNESCN